MNNDDRITLKRIMAKDLKKGDRMLTEPRSRDTQAVLVVADVEHLSYERKAIEGGGTVPFIAINLVEPPDTGENEYVRTMDFKPHDLVYIEDVDLQPA